jgi:hypothetical protein
MRKSTMNKLFVIVIFVIIVIIIYKYVTFKPTLISAKLNPTYELYMTGTEQDIREHLDKPGSTIKQSALLSLIDRERNDLLEMLLKEYEINPDIGGGYYSFTPLTYAAEELKVRSVELLVEYGADVDYLTRHNETALIKAATNLEFSEKNVNVLAIKIINVLVDSGADINIVNEYGLNLIQRLAFSNELSLLSKLFDIGGDINQVDIDKSNLLFYCRTLECIDYLISKGLDKNSVNNNGKNLLQSSVFIPINNIEKVKGLIEVGIDLCHHDNEGDNILRYAEEGNLNPHLHKDNPEFYQMKLAEHRATEVYKYLEKEYNKKCLTLDTN